VALDCSRPWLFSLTMSQRGYVHHRALADGGEPDYGLDVADDAQTNYLRFVGELCLPHLGSTVLDVGAGFGSITEQIATGRTVTALDTSPACADALRSRFADNSNVTVVHGDLSALGTERFDSILLTNVLEHIADDAGFLADLKSRLLPRGRIVIYVPALNGLYTGWDRKVGHYRRYSKRRLAGVICEADDHLAVTYMRYANMLAIPAWLFSGRMVDEKAREARSLDAWDRYAVPVVRAVESRVPPPIGLNLLGVAGLKS
jgi:SAM-dependent methyltransferase